MNQWFSKHKKGLYTTSGMLIAVALVAFVWNEWGVTSRPGIGIGADSSSGSSTSGSSMAVETKNQKPVPMKFVRDGQNVKIDMYTEETNVPVAPGETVHAWTFDGTVPGPAIQLQQDDKVTLTLHNLDPSMPHSIDLHAAQVAPNVNIVDVLPGQTKTVHFDADVPGVFLYHCGSQPMILHMGMGMYGAVVVTPKGGEAPTYTIVQSEVYAHGNYQDMLNGLPQYVVFNGQSLQYMDHPLQAKVGQPVTIAFVNAGPNDVSAFHIVGALIQDAEASGNPQNHVYDVQTDLVAPGDGALIKVTFQQPGQYTFLTHVAKDASKGAMGMMMVGP